MKIVLFGIILHKLLCVVNSLPGFGGCWTSPSFGFSVGAGAVDAPTPPPLPDTTVLSDSSSDSSNPAPAPSPPAPAPPATPDTFASTTDRSLTIFYDAMEENSQTFFNTTLIKEFQCIPSFINVTFIPCQKAMDSSGSLTCPAQADPTCTLNKVHSCAIAQITDRKQLIGYLACTMKSLEKLPDFITCANQNNVNNTALQECTNSDQGANLCKDYSAKKMPDMNTLPGFIFKKPEDIKTTDLFEHVDYYRNHICYNDLTSAICSELIVSNAPSPPSQCYKVRRTMPAYNFINQLVVGIFYKTMNEKSQKWFHTLGTIYDKFSSYINFKYQPCMFAELPPDGKLDCQDDNDQNCMLGKTHSCAIWLVKEPKTLYQFLNCTMQCTKTQPDYEKCATDYNIQYDPIKACANSDRGRNLCYDSSKTRPNSVDIPMFSFELTFDEDTSKNTSEATDLQTIFCDQLKKYKINTPQECNAKCYTR